MAEVSSGVVNRDGNDPDSGNEREATIRDGRAVVPPIRLELSGDQIYAAVQDLQGKLGIDPPQTNRRPDVRGIVLNLTGEEIQFQNPGGHSEQTEKIPSGEAFMLMFRGDSLADQTRNAQDLFERFELLENGVTPDFLDALRDGSLSGLVAEAYGPAPYDKQRDALIESLIWRGTDGNETQTNSLKGDKGSFGIRAPGKEEVYCVQVEGATSQDVSTLRGTNTVAENLVAGRIYLAISRDWQTGAISTRPIVPAVAEEFYGEHINTIPTVVIDRAGAVRSLNLD